MLKRSKCFPCVSLLWALLVANPCWCEFSFSLVNLEGFPRKWAPTQQEPLRKDKIRGQKAPCGRKKWLAHYPNPAWIYLYLSAWFVGDSPLSACFFTTSGSYFVFLFVFLMSSGRLVGLFTGSPKGSQGNKHTWLPGMAASQTYKGRHKEIFLSFN